MGAKADDAFDVVELLDGLLHPEEKAMINRDHEEGENDKPLVEDLDGGYLVEDINPEDVESNPESEEGNENDEPDHESYENKTTRYQRLTDSRDYEPIEPKKLPRMMAPMETERKSNRKHNHKKNPTIRKNLDKRKTKVS